MNSIKKNFRFLLSMQNGPNDFQNMDSWLIWTGIGELINVVIFSILLVWLNYFIPNIISTASIAGGSILCIILFQGGLYWIIKRCQVWNGLSAITRVNILLLLYVLNIIMFIFAAIVIFQRLIASFPINMGDWIIGLLYFSFALAEFIHYYVIKINMRPVEWKMMIQNNRLIPARMIRELRQARSELNVSKKIE